jgi:hypothetical protein
MNKFANKGSLATRNGRIIGENFMEILIPSKGFKINIQVCYNEDIEYDF